MIKVQSRFTAVFTILGLVLSSLVQFAPASAITGITPSAAGPFTYTVGTAITNITFTETAANGETTYSVLPALPAGLTLDTATGTISGTPTAAKAATDYVITSSDAGNTTTATATINITVRMSITPLDQERTFTAGTAITPTTAFTVNGGAGTLEYTVSPALPAGLSISSTTGVISGTPQIAQGETSYTITVTDDNNLQRTSTIAIQINARITPTTQTITGTAGSAITPTTPFTTAGFTGLITYTISPALPAGLSLSSTTGVVSGTPTAGQAATSYTITATDSLSKTATSTVSIAVTASTITPATQTLSATAGVAITATTAFTPTGFTGAVTYAISPALPAGLTMSTTTGVISGTPTANQAATVHTITATGATAGSATATITVTVAARILPTSQTVNAAAGTAITATTAYTAAGFTGTVVYSVSPALPAGLSLNTTSGVITGTPTTAQSATAYTITATGTTAGSTTGSGVATATVTISVGASISPSTRTVAVTQGQAMTPTAAYTATGFNGGVTYTINPALPAGLVLNSTTGVVSGTPATIASATNYTITATGATAGSATTTLTLTVLAQLTAPAGVTATAGDASATVSWNAVSGATSYQVVSEPAAGSCAVTGTTATCTGLTNGTKYAFRVTPVNQAGASTLSTLSAQVTPKPPFVTKTGKLTITYTATGTVVPAASLVRIRAIGTQFKADKGTSAVITVKGFSSKTATALEKRLASSRATLAANALRAAGLRGTYTTTGDGVTNRVGAKARKVVITYTYTAPN